MSTSHRATIAPEQRPLSMKNSGGLWRKDAYSNVALGSGSPALSLRSRPIFAMLAGYRTDGANVTDPVLNDGSSTYTPGISVHSGSASTFQHADYLGSNTTQTNSSQSVTATEVFDAFGNLRSSTGTLAGPFGFVGAQGYQSDADSGLMLLGRRYYDPSTERFMTRDTAKDGRNWYVCCGSDAVARTDATGQNWIGKGVGGLVGSLIAGTIIVLTAGAPILVMCAVGAVWVSAGAAVGEASTGGTSTSILQAGEGGLLTGGAGPIVGRAAPWLGQGIKALCE